MFAVVLSFATCSGAEPTEACPTPVPESKEAGVLSQARDAAEFALIYPCYLPNTERLDSQAVVGESGKQTAELVFTGPFDITLRQSQVAPEATPDPTGASRTSINIEPNVPAILIERNDGSSKALYHLYWERNDLFYELQAFGPPLQRRIILEIVRSLQ